jgi:hypothetical protein
MAVLVLGVWAPLDVETLRFGSASLIHPWVPDSKSQARQPPHRVAAEQILQVPLPSQNPDVQVVPDGWLPVTKHWDAPVEQDVAVVWIWHGLLPAQAVPVVQPTQLPLLVQTLPVPQFVPGDLAPLAKHWDVPVEQEIAVDWASQGLLVSHAVPVVQATQLPLLLQTRLAPQFVPADLEPLAKHWDVPVEQEIAVLWL